LLFKKKAIVKLFLLSFLPMRKNLILPFFLQKKGVKSLFSLSFVRQQKKISCGTGKASATIQKVHCGEVNNPVLFQFSLKSGETSPPVFGGLIANLNFISPAVLE